MTDRHTESRAVAQSPAQTISNGMVGLISRYAGRGPTQARTALNSNFVLVSFHDTLTRAEQNLVDAGRSGVVLDMRRTFHAVMREEATALVETALGREVVSLLSDIDLEAGIAVMVFLLDRVPDSETVEIAEVAGE